MTRVGLRPALVTGIIVGLLFALALFLRVYVPQEWVFTDGRVNFIGADSYYHMRLVDSLVENFPRTVTFDPYLFYPHGSTWPHMPFFDWLLAGGALLVGFGSPTQHTVEVVSAVAPAVMGALAVIPVYFIGRGLFGRWAGVLSAAVIAILPGEFMGRSLLGFSDHHVAEALFSALAMMFLLLAIRSARRREITLRHLRARDWPAIRRPLIFSLLAGLFLGVYLLSWIGGPLFVFIIFLYVVVQSVIDHLKGRSGDYLCVVTVVSLAVASLMLLPLSPGGSQTAALLIALAAPLALNVLSRLMAARTLRPAYYPAAVLGLAAVGLLLFRFVSPTVFESVMARFSIFSPSGVGLTITELRPLFFPGSSFSTALAWEMFTTSLYFSFAALLLLGYRVFRHGDAGVTLLLVWSLVVLAATLGARRYAYYFAVNAALLTGYISWQMLRFLDVGRWAALYRRKAAPVSPRARRTSVVLGVAIVFLVVFAPNLGLPPDWKGPTTTVVRAASQLAPSDAWYDSLVWLRENTPEPLGTPEAYFDSYLTPPAGERYSYPESAYGVMAWWDYGHWITRIARRLPNHGPGGNWSVPVARSFTAQDEATAAEIIDRLGSRYLVIDYATATGKFHAMVTLADGDPDDFREAYFIERDNLVVRLVFFYPEYYRALSTRLYNFDGRAVTPESTMVIAYQEALTGDGTAYKLVTDARSFPSYREAADFVADQDSDKHRIVSTDPMTSPVPLVALEGFRRVYVSGQSTLHLGSVAMPTVKVFEYVE